MRTILPVIGNPFIALNRWKGGAIVSRSAKARKQYQPCVVCGNPTRSSTQIKLAGKEPERVPCCHKCLTRETRKHDPAQP